MLLPLRQLRRRRSFRSRWHQLHRHQSLGCHRRQPRQLSPRAQREDRLGRGAGHDDTVGGEFVDTSAGFNATHIHTHIIGIGDMPSAIQVVPSGLALLSSKSWHSGPAISTVISCAGAHLSRIGCTWCPPRSGLRRARPSQKCLCLLSRCFRCDVVRKDSQTRAITQGPFAGRHAPPCRALALGSQGSQSRPIASVPSPVPRRFSPSPDVGNGD